jgi:uncharacterized SAM-binding protein YcdF (DUF218 family)
MFFALSKLLRFLVYPLPLGFFLLVGVLVFYRQRWARRVLLVVVVGCYGASIPYTADRLMGWLELPRTPPEMLRPPYDAVVVLSGMLHLSVSRGGHIEFNQAVDRILTGIAFVQQGLGKTLLLSGGSGDLFQQQTSEAALLQTFALQHGLTADQVLVEATSRNTYENAVYTARLLQAHHVRQTVLITSAVHMRRAVAAFHKQGIFPDIYPVDYQATDTITPFSFLPSVHSLVKTTEAVRELVGLIMYRLQGYI